MSRLPVVKASMASLPVMPSLARVTSARVNEVPAVEASTPALTSAPIALPVSSILRPIDCAVTPTTLIADP